MERQRVPTPERTVDPAAISEGAPESLRSRPQLENSALSTAPNARYKVSRQSSEECGVAYEMISCGLSRILPKLRIEGTQIG
jgi:hypothetical protein